LDKPRFITRLFFWLLLGLLSTFFAEYLSGSAPDFLLTAFGYIGIFPIYCLHTLILAALVIRPGRHLSLRSLYFVSLLFGMYEAYITKVLWEPFWDPEALRIANIAVFETILLVLFWHSIFSFIIPLFLSEYLLLDSNRLHSLLPEKWRSFTGKYRAAVLFGLISSILFATSANSIDEAIMFSLINCTVVSIALVIWRRLFRKKQFDITRMLPQKAEIAILFVLLTGVYLILGLNLNRHVQPGLIGHVAIILMYIVIIIMTTASIRKDQQTTDISDPQAPIRPAAIGMKHWFLFCAALFTGSVLVNLLPQGAQDLITVCLFLVYTGSGVFLFILSTHSLIKKKRKKIQNQL
jgi:hypothetical protein